MIDPAEQLAFEAKVWVAGGAKEAAIRKHFGVSPLRYYQALRRLIHTETALQIDPITTRRLRSARHTWRAPH